MSLLSGLYNLSLRSAVDLGRKRLGLPGPRITPPDVSFLRSAEYRRIMNAYVPWNGEYGKHEALTYTESYIHRHKRHLAKLGVFRWRSMQEHLDDVLDRVTRPGIVVIDFGGAGCPLGLGSVVVDRLKTDAAGRPVQYSDLKQLPMKADVVFACHVLEHVPNLDEVITSIHDVLKPGGEILVLVPSFSNVNWRAGPHHNRRYGEHVWTFGLSGTKVADGLHNYRDIDTALAAKFHIDAAEYCGDDNIWVRGHKSATPSA